MDRLEHLALFIRINEKGGIASAGRDFGLTAATASDRLAALEKHYGAKLLNRTTRAISLTEEGKVLLDKAKFIVSEADDLEAQIKYGVERLSGTIRISAPNDLGCKRIAPLLDIFMDTHPDVNLELSLGDGYDDLVGRGVDLAIRLGALRDSSLRVRKLGDNRRVICASPSYLERYGIPTHPDSLEHHNCLTMKLGEVLDREWVFKVNGRNKAYMVSGNRTANSGALVRDWCIDGRGLALKSIWDVTDDLHSGKLVEVLSEYAQDSQTGLQIVYPGGMNTPRRIRACIDFLVSAFESK
ncbi:LysR family transcriptional regulator [Shewanella canadensis]|uniref:LysR family transcriptional regulator n=1 Tax=Shewanella canadensis TaxID=271096 RepID=A0A431WSR0_9GAMM|nr:LysR family transcriptional regulator [Shewanella canadensis]RTR38473.1 LysR family transcriptional regulator [Shewanella canadensis]